ncbi:MAG: DUF2752 domain-containing protein [Solobacterium sp.]|nr:DUF2752 domain-containing protein [Solobacterium sp.]
MKNKDYVNLALTFICILFFFYLFDITCPIKYITGLSCAGCGMTRAYLSLFHFDIPKAISFHPLFPLPPIVLLIVFNKHKFSKKAYTLTLSFILILFLLTYFLRLANPDDAIVVFEPQHSLVYKILHLLNYN